MQMPVIGLADGQGLGLISHNNTHLP